LLVKRELPQAVLLTGVGSADTKAARALFDRVADTLRAAFPEIAGARIEYGVTSRSLLRRGDSGFLPVAGALQRLQEAGIRRAIVLPLHLLAGSEFSRGVRKPVEEYAGHFENLQLIEPLLSAPGNPEGYEKLLATAVGDIERNPEEELVLVGHGSRHGAHESYRRLQEIADERWQDVHIGCLMGEPGLVAVDARLAARCAASAGTTDSAARGAPPAATRPGTTHSGATAPAIVLSPLLVFPGNHTFRDIAGEEPDSWQSRLAARGYQVRSDVTTLGQRPAIARLYGEMLQ
jgi:sirohydrochlorin cobaltochelatase